MQVSVESTGTLERRMTVAVPEERISNEVKERLKSMRQRVRIDGFRPGKAPLPVVQRKYGKQVRDEVIGEVMQSTLYEALAQEKLNPAGAPAIDPANLEQDNGLQYTAVFEVYPEFELAPCSEIKIEKPVTDISEQDIDDTLESIRKQRIRWEEKQGAAADGDQLVMDFVGTIDGEPFEGGKAEDFQLVLGAGRMIDGFEDGLKEAKAGEERVLNVTFPENYHASELAGKAASFSVNIKRVEAPVLPEVDDEFAKHLGISGGVSALREEVKANMQRELDQALKSRIKQQVMDKLLEANKIALPKSLVNQEARGLAAQMQQQMAQQGLGSNDSGAVDPAPFTEQAERRVSLGLIVAHIIKANELKASVDDVRATVEEMAQPYEQPQEVVDWYHADKKRLAEVEALVLENNVVDWVLAQAQVEEKPISFTELTAKQ